MSPLSSVLYGMRLRPFLVLCLVACLHGAGLASKLVSDSDPGPGKGSLSIEVVGVESDRGHVLVALYTSGDAWPEPDGAYATREVRARKGKVVVSFDELPAGAYAIAIMHDADDNGRMTTSIVGIPKEAYGFGNDARATFSAPSFGESLVEVSGKTKVVVNIK